MIGRLAGNVSRQVVDVDDPGGVDIVRGLKDFALSHGWDQEAIGIAGDEAVNGEGELLPADRQDRLTAAGNQLVVDHIGVARILDGEPDVGRIDRQPGGDRVFEHHVEIGQIVAVGVLDRQRIVETPRPVLKERGVGGRAGDGVGYLMQLQLRRDQLDLGEVIQGFQRAGRRSRRIRLACRDHALIGGVGADQGGIVRGRHMHKEAHGAGHVHHEGVALGVRSAVHGDSLDGADVGGLCGAPDAVAHIQLRAGGLDRGIVDHGRAGGGIVRGVDLARR